MVGPIFAALGDIAATAWDFQLLEGAAKTIGSYRWGHLPTSDLIHQSSVHIANTNEIYRQKYQHLDPAELIRLPTSLRGDIRTEVNSILRDTRFLANAMDMKQQSVERKFTGEEQTRRLQMLATPRATLGEIEKTLTKGLEELNATKPPTKERLWHQGADAVSALKIFAYKRPILCGSAMIAAMVGIPLAMLYQAVKSGYSDLHNVGEQMRPNPNQSYR